MAISTEG